MMIGRGHTARFLWEISVPSHADNCSKQPAAPPPKDTIELNAESSVVLCPRSLVEEALDQAIAYKDLA